MDVKARAQTYKDEEGQEEVEEEYRFGSARKNANEEVLSFGASGNFEKKKQVSFVPSSDSEAVSFFEEIHRQRGDTVD